MIFDIKDLINKILELNPNSQIKEDISTPPKSDADARVTIVSNINELKLPGGFYIDGNTITNKIVENIPYITLEVVTIKKAKTIEEYIDEEVRKLNEQYPNIVNDEQKESAKEIFKNSTQSLEEQEKEVDLIVQKTTIDYLEKFSGVNIPKEPKMTSARQSQKEEHKNQKLVLLPNEKRIYEVLKVKKKIQKQKVKKVVKKPKKQKAPSKILSSKGFTNVMYISVVVIIILVVYIIIMEV